MCRDLDLKMLEIADIAAEDSPHNFRMGAVIASRRNILGIGHSKYTAQIPRRLYSTHHRSSLHCAMHAETATLKDALLHGYAVNGATIYVSGFTKAGNRPKSCRPCRNCVRVLCEYGVRRVVYRTSDGNFAESRLNELSTEEMVCTSCNQSSSRLNP